MENKEKIWAKGIRFEKPKAGLPEFIKGKLSFKVDDAIQFLNEHKDERGWVNLDLKKSKEKGTLYLELNTYKKKTQEDSDEDQEAKDAFDAM